ncbi:integrator complex subunit 6-like isoform X2 [Polyodon spathula]|uniref:integrator complex subunit 6-like isoform X2 n=1 Tax=Polyodon spathula TaxID=7913 RepID=UPI001B7E2C21|nr:integrator complex subunit 6-like isoform X2 [Polyodon spathula]
MPVLLFLIDTSASMNQRAHLGTTYLDIAKGAVETFMKLRSRDPASRGDRYMLVTFEEFPSGVKAGWKENHATFMHELKNLQAVGLTTVGQSLRTAFDLLNLNRLVSGIDNYGQGRNPFFLEPSIIVTITDGSKLTSSSGIQDELHLPLSTPLPGSELTKEPFRWDQRLFALVLRIPGNMAVEPEQMMGVPQDDSAITPMCEVTGGRSYSVCSQRMLNQCLESLVQKIQSGVVINFEKTGPVPPPIEDGPPDASKPVPQVWHSCHKLIYVRPNPKTGVPIGHWPIPEAFWPDQNSPTLVGVYPSRTAHPQVRFSCIDSEPMVIDKLPFDKYELEPSPLTQYILERKSPHTCWQVFVCNSAKYSDLGQPFGYLKASTALNCVNMFVMPYDFPVLLPLLDDLFKVHKLKPTLTWRQSFEVYLKTMPPYYIGPLKKALRMMGAPNLIAENMEYGLSYSVVSYLKKLSQQAKVESDRVIALIGKKPVQENGVQLKNKAGTLSLAHCKDFKQLLKGITGEAPHVLQELNMKEFTGFQIGILNKDLKPQSFRNAYDIPRRSLLDHLSRMRSNLLKATQGLLKGQDEDQLHSIPIAQMGNYQEFLKLSPSSPLREVDPDQPKRLHTFGNPFKLDKKGMMIDEADEFVSGPQNKSKRPGDPSMQGVPKRRRCMSPLLRGGRPLTPPAVNNHIGGKGSPSIPVTLAHPNLVKPIPVCKDMRQQRSSDETYMARSPEENPNAFTDCVIENHIGSHNSLETLPDPVPDLNSDTDPFSMKQLPAGTENHIGELGNSRSGVDDIYTVSPTGTHEDSEEGGACLEEGLHQSRKMKKLNHSKSEENNTELKVLITREIRKPGRRYERIFYFLEQVQGSLHTRLLFLQNVIKEAARFKKRVLIEQLEGFLEEIHCRYNRMNHVDSI